MPRKKNPNKQCALYVDGLTNGHVEELRAAGFLPILRWVKKSEAFRKRRKLYKTYEAKRLSRAVPSGSEGT